jgi:hypothetical protein
MKPRQKTIGFLPIEKVQTLKGWDETNPMSRATRVDLVTVSSRRSTICPSSTSLPPLTRISPTTPPVGCCTFLMFDSTTIVPGAITAPANWLVAAQPPTPKIRSVVRRAG